MLNKTKKSARIIVIATAKTAISKPRLRFNGRPQTGPNPHGNPNPNSKSDPSAKMPFF